MAFEDAWVGSFTLPWEKINDSPRQCCIEGCDHRLNQCVADNVPSIISVVQADDQLTHVGYACRHCINLLFELNRA